MRAGLAAAAWLAILLAVPGTAGEPAKYKEMDPNVLKVAPEDHVNKGVLVRTQYKDVQITFFPYMENSGFKAGKHFWMVANPDNLPFLGEKRDKDVFGVVEGLRKGDEIVVSGKLKRFTSKPGNTKRPYYYLLVESVGRSTGAGVEKGAAK